MAHECEAEDRSSENDAESREESGGEEREGEGVWQGGSAGAEEALRCVFSCLDAPALWRCGAVCRAWRAAAADPALWRRLLRPRATPRTLRALHDMLRREQSDVDVGEKPAWSWRREYALTAARWEKRGALWGAGGAGGGGGLQCAALHGAAPLLALVDEDAHVTVWEFTTSNDGDLQWKNRWSGVVSKEWDASAGVHAEWAPGPAAPHRLLLAGVLALAHRYEIIIMQFDDWHRGTVVSRSAGGPGAPAAAARWLDRERYLCLRLQLIAPAPVRATTAVTINTASQETQSEFAGVTAPLLRIYNEAATQITHVLVVKAPHEEPASDYNCDEELAEASCEPRASYYDSLRPVPQHKELSSWLIAAGGVEGGARGCAQALRSWQLRGELRPARVRVDDCLTQRVRARRLHREHPPAEDPPESPDESAVRALCTAPDYTLDLHHQILGLVVHPRGGCVWATTEGGPQCAALPSLRPLLRLRTDTSDPPRPRLDSYYVMPTVDDDYFISPSGAGGGASGAGGAVRVWGARSGARGAALRLGAPALATLLVPRALGSSGGRTLLVLTPDGLHVWRSLHII